MKSARVIAVAAVVIDLALEASACSGQSTAAPSPPGASASAKGGVNSSRRGVHLTVHWNLPKTVDVRGDGATAATVAQGGAVELEGQDSSDKDVRAKLGDAYIIGNNPGIGRPDLTLHAGTDRLDPISVSEGTGWDQWIGKVMFHLQRDQDNGAGTRMFQVWVSQPRAEPARPQPSPQGRAPGRVAIEARRAERAVSEEVGPCVVAR